MADKKFNTNFVAISSDVEAPNANYKCFVKWLNESYIKTALTSNLVLYLDMLEQFWDSATVEVNSLEDGTVTYTIFCMIQKKGITITTEDMNKALGLQ